MYLRILWVNFQTTERKAAGQHIQVSDRITQTVRWMLSTSEVVRSKLTTQWTFRSNTKSTIKGFHICLDNREWLEFVFFFLFNHKCPLKTFNTMKFKIQIRFNALKIELQLYICNYLQQMIYFDFLFMWTSLSYI